MAEQVESHRNSVDPSETYYVAIAARVQALELHREYENKSLQEIKTGQAEAMGKIDLLVSGMQAAHSDQEEYGRRAVTNENRAVTNENRVSSLEEWRGRFSTDFAVLKSALESYIANEGERRKEMKDLMNTLVNRWGLIIGVLSTIIGTTITVVLHFFK